MSELLKLDLLGASKALKAKSISSLELTNAYLTAIEKTSELGAYLQVVSDHALEMAKASDKNLANNTSRPLEGLPIGVKDMFFFFLEWWEKNSTMRFNDEYNVMNE